MTTTTFAPTPTPDGLMLRDGGGLRYRRRTVFYLNTLQSIFLTDNYAGLRFTQHGTAYGPALPGISFVSGASSPRTGRVFVKPPGLLPLTSA